MRRLSINRAVIPPSKKTTEEARGAVMTKDESHYCIVAAGADVRPLIGRGEIHHNGP